jgi:hypothetical protein
MRTDAPARAGENAAPEVKKRLDAIRSRLEAATPGPWAYHQEYHQVFAVVNGREWFIQTTGGPRVSPEADLIANAPADIAYLLALVETLAAAVVLVDSALDAVTKG